MTILVGTEFSAESQAAAQVGALLAKQLGTAVHLVYVSRDPRAPLVLRTQEEHLLAEDFRQLNAAAEALRERFGVRVETELAAGSVVDALCDTAEFLLADFLVVAASGRSNVLIGSTAERVARQARVPTLVVRTPERMLAWLEGQRPLQVLVGSDLSEVSRQAEASGARLERAGALDVEVVHVAHVPSVHDRYGLPAPVDLHRLDASAEQLLLRDLDAQAEGLSYRNPRRTRLVAATTTADAHLAVLADQADLVVVGNRKRAWLEQAWYGSTTRGLLRSAPTNVLCVPKDPLTPQVPPARRLQVIVAATDFSALGDQAMYAALGLANGDATLHLVHVLPGYGQETPEARAAVRKLLRERSLVASQGVGPGCKVMTEVLVGDPADAIAAFARRVGADVICVGTHGRSGFGALLLGSTTQKLLGSASAPLFVVPPPET